MAQRRITPLADVLRGEQDRLSVVPLPCHGQKEDAESGYGVLRIHASYLWGV